MKCVVVKQPTEVSHDSRLVWQFFQSADVYHRVIRARDSITKCDDQGVMLLIDGDRGIG